MSLVQSEGKFERQVGRFQDKVGVSLGKSGSGSGFGQA